MESGFDTSAKIKRLQQGLEEAERERDMERNKAELLQEDLDAAHKCLDDLSAPRSNENRAEFSIYGRLLRVIEPIARERDEMAAYSKKLQQHLSEAYRYLPYDSGLAVKIGNLIDEDVSHSLAEHDAKVEEETIEECFNQLCLHGHEEIASGYLGKNSMPRKYQTTETQEKES
jgi:hypothetical protein